MEKLCALLFELSNEDRLNILFELKKAPMKLSRVAEKFGFTVPETARNISRLSEAKLIEKCPDGSYYLTSYGEASLQFLPGLGFLSKHKEYFKNHTLSRIPSEYAANIGVLADSEFVKEVTTTISEVENMIRHAQEFIWFMIDQILANAVVLIGEAVDRGVKFRKILPRNVVIPEDTLKLCNDPFIEQAGRAKKVESRYIDKIDVSIFVSEKGATILFPNLEGQFDFFGFRSKNELAVKWAKSLFSSYWDRAKR